MLLGTAPFTLLGAQGLIGTWQGVERPALLSVRADGGLELAGQLFRYQVDGSVLWVQNVSGEVAQYRFQLQGDQLVLAGDDLGTFRFRRVGGAVGAPVAGMPGAPTAPAGPGAPPPAAPVATPGPGPARAAAVPALPDPSQAFQAEAYGFRMIPCQGWTAGVREGAVIFGHGSVPGMLIVSPYPGAITAEDLRAAATRGWQEEGIQLVPVTPGQVRPVATGQGMGLYFPVRGSLQGSAVEGLLAGFLGPTGVCVVVLGVTTPERWAELEPHARMMIESVRLTAAASPAVGEWTQELTGRKVTHMWSYYSGGGADGSYVGGGTNKVWNLCPDGTYSYTGSSDVSADGGMGGGAWVTGSSQGGGSERGRWSLVPEGAQGAAIVFQPQGGQGYRYSLSRQKKLGSSYMQKYFGDMKIFATEDVQCP